MVRIILPSVWTQDGRTDFDTDEGPLHDVIRRFAADHPDYRHRLLTPDGEPLSYINICVDDDLIPRHRRQHTRVPADSTVTVIAPMAGG